MPAEDAERWNQRYRDGRYGSFREVRPLLAAYSSLIKPGSLVLDLACGLGGNAAHLLPLGYRVVGVDIAYEALRQAKYRMPDLQAVLADLTELRFPSQLFDAILNFYYLQRDLWPEFERMLRPGGLLFFETLTEKMLSVKPDIDPRFLLHPGELSDTFQHWEILYSQEGWQENPQGKNKHTACLVARRAENHL